MGTDQLASFIRRVKAVRGKVALPVHPEWLHQISTQHNNWVVPGWIMAGPYPGLDGLNYPSEQAACTNLQGIIKDGCNVFVSLCSELAPQSEDTQGSTTCQAYFPKYANYAYLIKLHGLAGSKTIVYDTLQIQDHGVPSPAGLVSLLHRILGYLHAGKRVFIHCAGGHGRTGTVLACLLYCLCSASLDDVLRHVQYCHDLRQQLDKRCTTQVRSPNSAAQIKFVTWFSDFLQFALNAAAP